MIQLRTFNLEKINEIKHYHLIRNLADDKGIYDYVSKNFVSWLEKQQSISDDVIEPEKSYVIVRDNEYIGIIGTLNFTSNGILELWCGIDKKYRNHGYGEKILAEITPYLIEKVEGLNDIKLRINKYNIASQKVATKNGYIKEDEKDGIYEYYYFGQKKR